MSNPTMQPPFTKVHYDFEALPPLTSPRRELGLEAVGLGLIRLPAGKGYTFMHHHEEQEEVYVVIDGAGELLVGEVFVPLERGDLVRVSASARRALHAGPDGPLTVFCAGAVPAAYPRDPNARYLIDDGVPHYDDLPPWCAGDPAVLAKNAELAERMKRSRERR